MRLTDSQSIIQTPGIESWHHQNYKQMNAVKASMCSFSFHVTAVNVVNQQWVSQRLMSNEHQLTLSLACYQQQRKPSS